MDNERQQPTIKVRCGLFVCPWCCGKISIATHRFVVHSGLMNTYDKYNIPLMYFCYNTWDDIGMKKKTLVEDMTNISHQDICRIERCKQYDRSLDRFVMTTRRIMPVRK